MCRHNIAALEKLEFICITAWTGITASGGSSVAIMDTSIMPPPRPKAADITDVKKLVRHNIMNDVPETFGAEFIISVNKSMFQYSYEI